MLRTYLYIPEYLERKIKQTAKSQNKSKAEVMRQALDKGISQVAPEGNASARVLLKIAEIGRKCHLKGPKDGSENMDHYLWDKDWTK